MKLLIDDEVDSLGCALMDVNFLEIRKGRNEEKYCYTRAVESDTMVQRAEDDVVTAFDHVPRGHRRT